MQWPFQNVSIVYGLDGNESSFLYNRMFPKTILITLNDELMEIYVLSSYPCVEIRTYDWLKFDMSEINTL